MNEPLTRAPTLEEIRQHLKLVMELEPCGLRGLEELVGVSFSTLSRFIRGADPDMRTLKKFYQFMKGEPEPKTKPKVIRRFKVGSKEFVVEIREV